MKRLAFAVCLCLLVPGIALASTLEDKRVEWAFSVASVDQDNIGQTTEIDFEASYIFSGGYFQVGLAASAFDVEFDDDTLDDLLGGSGSSIGPVFVWNWFPQAQHVTGYLHVSIQAIGGDVSDVYDAFGSAGVGLKAFIGDSAAINVLLSNETYEGKDNFEDLEQSRLLVGLSLYTHGR